MRFFLIFLPLSPPFVFSLTAKMSKGRDTLKGNKEKLQRFSSRTVRVADCATFFVLFEDYNEPKTSFQNNTKKKIKSYDAYIPGFISDVCLFFIFLNRQNIPEIRRQNLSSILRVGEKATCDRSLIKLVPGVFIKRQNRYRLPPCGFIYFKASSSFFFARTDARALLLYFMAREAYTTAQLRLYVITFAHAASHQDPFFPPVLLIYRRKGRYDCL